MINAYDKGDLVRLFGEFTDLASNNYQDPAAVFIQVRNPAGVTVLLTYGVDAALIKQSIGIYYTDIPLTASGEWYYRFYSTGEGQAASEDKFFVRESKLG